MPAFGELVVATLHKFGHTSARGHSESVSLWRKNVSNFFRRSGFYLDVLDRKHTDLGVLFPRYVDAFTRETCKATYFAPIEFVYFHKRSFDFGSFGISRHTEAQLDHLLSTRSNRAFYPWASIDTTRLSDYWLLSSSTSEPVPKIGHFDLSGIHGVELRYTSFPPPLERALDAFCLFEWQADMLKPLSEGVGNADEVGIMGWEGPNIPFVLRSTDNLLESPLSAPDMSILCQEPFFDADGEHLGERPCIHPAVFTSS